MVDINVKEAKAKVNSLKEVLSSYKENHKAIEFEFNNMISNWKNNKNPIFFSAVNDNQLTNIKLICKLEEELNTLNTSIEKYSELGKKIKCDLDQRDYILSKYNNIYNKISDILTKYYALGGMSFYNNNYKVIATIETMKNQKAEISNIRDKVSDKYQYIQSIETDLSSVINSSKELTISNNLNYSTKEYTDDYEFNIEEVRLSNKKLSSLFSTQDDLINDIKNGFIELNDSYDSPSFNEILSYNTSIYESLNSVFKTNTELYSEVNDICDDYAAMIAENIRNWEGV